MRVLLTRAAEDCARSARFLRRLGIEAVCAPLIETRPADPPPPLATCDGVIVTSAKAAPYLAQLPPVCRTAPVFAVGPRTARALARHGFAARHVGAGDALSLLRDIPRLMSPPAHLVHVTGRDHKAEPAQGLRALGFCLTLWEAYEARALLAFAQEIVTALEAGEIHAALHYSPRSAKLALARVGEAGLAEPFNGLRHVAISLDVAMILRQAGCPNVAAASAPNEKAMFRVLLGM
ncbi:MAG: uroporphyrinogen-III synthase [Salinarimonas sp.]|nr:uroporphyrinogen-III synthase [Salinarimonas sp.]